MLCTCREQQTSIAITLLFNFKIMETAEKFIDTLIFILMWLKFYMKVLLVLLQIKAIGELMALKALPAKYRKVCWNLFLQQSARWKPSN